MEFKIIIKSQEFVDKYLKQELMNITKLKVKKIDSCFYEINVNSILKLNEIVYNLYYYSRLIENIYLFINKSKNLEKLNCVKKDLNFINNKLNFKINFDNYLIKNNNLKYINYLKDKLVLNIQNINLNLSENLDNFDFNFLVMKLKKEYYFVLDLIGFNLTSRDYKLNKINTELNPLIINFLFNLMQINNKNLNYSIIDPIANYGDLIIECSIFNLNIPIHIKKRHILPIKKIFNFIPKIPKFIKSKNKYIAIVQDNITFKKINENIIYSKQKIKLSQYEIDWLDIKFEESQIDYVISNFKMFDNQDLFEKFQQIFFYQCEFICKKKIGIITKNKINLEILKKNNLKINKFETIFLENNKYFIYVINSNK